MRKKPYLLVRIAYALRVAIIPYIWIRSSIFIKLCDIGKPHFHGFVQLCIDKDNEQYLRINYVNIRDGRNFDYSLFARPPNPRKILNVLSLMGLKEKSSHMESFLNHISSRKQFNDYEHKIK